MTSKDELRELKEKLAAIEHERWADWQKWCHEVLYKELGWSDRLEKVLERWRVQIETPYSELSDREKASDMEQVDRYWKLIEDFYYQLMLSLVGEDEDPNEVFTDDFSGEQRPAFWNAIRNKLRAELRQKLSEHFNGEGEE